MADGCRPGFARRTLDAMTALIALLTMTVLFALALRRGRPNEPPLPPGYDGERQLAELDALTGTAATTRLP